ncbi:hypothetical protein BCR32DRAFT_328588 [Anaeromyces robustus]|uniref:Cyclophilin-like domain-containing protein n=1 Tax=Anaeromyces robustus TaxID=1754192 RepID=A0A1Y1WXT6_9FUNG|nr:hypothetical protein BCR32DRAFT_328588 [Anaeromyces robustus]|eukprot:ORX78323.1 hypothetical protein BCR32DRAFT_328588 [Anaeromyces robustus]
MAEKSKVQKSPKTKVNKTKNNKQVKSKEPVNKSKTSSLVIGSVVVLILSIVLTLAFPYLKDNITSLTKSTTTTTTQEGTEKLSNIVKRQHDEFHPKLIISSDNNSEAKYEFKCTFEINETTKELVKQFPLTMKMVDLNGNEKYHTLETPLPVRIQPVDKVRLGDILLFQSRYLAVFYDTFDPVKKYSIVGKIDNPEKLREAVGTGSITAQFIQDDYSQDDKE